MGKWIATMAVLAMVSAVSAAQAPKGFCVGVASDTINPKEGTFLAGYDQNRRCTGVHDDLRAKTIVFWDGTSAVALVVLDAVSIQYDTTQEIRTAAAKQVTKIPLPPERILVQAIHTHAAPDTIGIYGPDLLHTGRDSEYMPRLVETAAKQVARAVDALQPAKLAYAETECKGWAVNDSEPELCDNSVTILQCLDKKGKLIATLTNFACHPTVLDGDNTLASCDWVGTFYKDMAAGLPGEHLFLQGAIGCWMQPETPERTFALAEKYGKDLAGKTLAALKSTKPLKDTAIRFANQKIEMPVTNVVFQTMSAMKLTPRPFNKTTDTEVAWFALGPAQFATHLGESAPMYAEQTRALMDTGPKFILGLGLDHLGYICPPKYFEQTDAIPHAKYLVSMSPGPEAGPTMMKALEAIVP